MIRVGLGQPCVFVYYRTRDKIKKRAKTVAFSDENPKRGPYCHPCVPAKVWEPLFIILCQWEGKPSHLQTKRHSWARACGPCSRAC